jgi:hypothetical protein
MTRRRALKLDELDERRRVELSKGMTRRRGLKQEGEVFIVEPKYRRA